MKKLSPKITGGMAVLLFAGTALSASVFGPAGPTAVSDTFLDLPDPDTFTRVLRAHVSPEDGRVDYAGLQADRSGLDRYLRDLATTDEQTLAAGTEEARIAFWINAYNACMLKLVVDHYPLTEATGNLWTRLKNLIAGRPGGSVWNIPDVFTREHCRVAGEERSQDQIEHGIIRPMGEPRIHFAVNCAAVSCPVLAAEAYTGRDLDAQLDRQVRRFVDDPRHFRIEGGEPPTLTVNKVLDWYGEDFDGPDGIRAFFLGYVEPREGDLLRDPATRVDFFEYDWTLNDTRR